MLHQSHKKTVTPTNPRRRRAEPVGATRMMINQEFDQGIIEGIGRYEMGINRIYNRQYKCRMATNYLKNLGGTLGFTGVASVATLTGGGFPASTNFSFVCEGGVLDGSLFPTRWWAHCLDRCRSRWWAVNVVRSANLHMNEETRFTRIVRHTTWDGRLHPMVAHIPETSLIVLIKYHTISPKCQCSDPVLSEYPNSTASVL